MKQLLLGKAIVALGLFLGVSQNAFASDYTTSTTAAGGYDVVAYHVDNKPVRGSGDFVANFEGETYLFASESNKKKFEGNPKRFAPAFGGYCAYGVAVGKKFIGDPELWKIVDNKLYFNLNPDIQKTWGKDINGNIVKAENHWQEIRDKAPADL